jgi:magnesium-transporting ATPase (P-type)
MKVDFKSGLSLKEVETRQKTYGPNELPEEEGESLWQKIKEQFEDILVRILLAAAVVSFGISYFGPEEENALPAWIEPCVILTILVLNACVGIY